MVENLVAGSSHPYSSQQKSLSFHLIELWSGHLIETLVAIGTMVW